MKRLILLSLILTLPACSSIWNTKKRVTASRSEVPHWCLKKAKESFKKWSHKHEVEFDAIEYVGDLIYFFESVVPRSGYDEYYDKLKNKLGQYPGNSYVFEGYSSQMGGSAIEAVVYSKKKCKFLGNQTAYIE